MANILQMNKVPTLIYNEGGDSEGKKIELLIIDVCPHLLKYAFTMVME
jgi:hypothetical protein